MEQSVIRPDFVPQKREKKKKFVLFFFLWRGFSDNSNESVTVCSFSAFRVLHVLRWKLFFSLFNSNFTDLDKE